MQNYKIEVLRHDKESDHYSAIFTKYTTDRNYYNAVKKLAKSEWQAKNNLVLEYDEYERRPGEVLVSGPASCPVFENAIKAILRQAKLK